MDRAGAWQPQFELQIAASSAQFRSLSFALGFAGSLKRLSRNGIAVVDGSGTGFASERAGLGHRPGGRERADAGTLRRSGDPT